MQQDIPIDNQEELNDEQDRQLIAKEYRKLLQLFDNKLNAEDQHLIREAFELAREAHKEVRRKDGDPYITHPIKVACICVEEIGLGPTAAACALLHDVVEDTDVTLDELRIQFPDADGKKDKNGLPKSKIADIVDGLTKLKESQEGTSTQAENISKVLKAMLTDVRVVLIKMADRLHNMRTIGSMRPDKQIKIAAETESVYTPLAHQLGLYEIKSELQDMCMKITYPDEYRDIKQKLAEKKESREAYIDRFILPIREQLDEFGINARIFGRPKSIYSIWGKMKKQKILFENIMDLFAIRIIVNVPMKVEKITCWQAYAIVTDVYKPIPERQKDWISMPKSNGYESLHTTVIGPDGRYVEVQIRSERMDEIAERGFAAHWKYKGVNGFASKANIFDDWLKSIREGLENAQGNAVEFLADVQSTIFVDNAVHAFTPKGDLKVLPKGATALDFAFAVHSNVGCTCQVVKINGVMQPFYYKLQNGDQVEIITNRNQKPAESWLQTVVTHRAQARIRSALNDIKRAEAAEGKDILARKLQNTYKVGIEENVDMLAKWYGFPNRLEFLSAVSSKQIDLKLLKRFRAEGLFLVLNDPAPRRDAEKRPSEVPQTEKKKKTIVQGIIINDQPGTMFKYTLASCCKPIQGEPIFAFLANDPEEGAKIHSDTCPNAKFLKSNFDFKVQKATWGNTVRSDYISDIVVNGTDKGRGVIRELSDCIAQIGINVKSFSISGSGGYFEGEISLQVSNEDQVTQAIMAIKKFDFVQNVRRVEPAAE